MIITTSALLWKGGEWSLLLGKLGDKCRGGTTETGRNSIRHPSTIYIWPARTDKKYIELNGARIECEHTMRYFAKNSFSKR